MMTAEYNCKHNDNSDSTYNRNSRADRFRNPAEGHLPATKCQGGCSNKEHAGVHHQQKVSTVMKQRCPETGFVMNGIAGTRNKIANDQRNNTYADQGQGPCPVGLWYF